MIVKRIISQEMLPTNKLKVFDVVEMRRKMDSSNTKSNVYQNMKLFLSYLDESDGELNLIPITRKIITDLLHLVLRFPNFKEVIEFYAEQLALQLLTTNAIVSIDPILIVGEAGIGKTFFSFELAKIINTPFEVLSFSTTTAGFVLSGSSPTWADGKPGKITETMAKHEVANPLIIIDEIDKVSSDPRYNPFGSLYQLLEQETAGNFTDEGLEVTSNCSRINWIATANELASIPDPILSRFTIFHVKPPSSSEMTKVVNSIYCNVLNSNTWGTCFDENLSSRVIDKIIESRVAPRRIQKEIKKACSQIALNHILSNKNEINERIQLKEEDFNIIDDCFKQRIGFI